MLAFLSRMKRFRFIVLVLYLSSACAQSGGCTYSYEGDYYDLSGLSSDSSDYKVQMSPASTVTWINVCRPVVSTICKSCCGSDVAGCMQWDPNSQNGQASIGAYSSATFMPLKGQKGVILLYISGLNARTYEVDFVCDPSQKIGAPVFANENPTKHYNFVWNTAQACPQFGCANSSWCQDCLSDGSGSCKWCLDSNQCEPNTEYDKRCMSYVQNPKFCPPDVCAPNSDCTSCAGESGCSWCLDSSSCIHTPGPNRFPCDNIISTPSLCPKGKVRLH